MRSPLSDDLLEIHEHASYSESYPADGLLTIRLALGLSRNDVYEIGGVVPLLLELHEEHGGWPDVETLIGLAHAYECTPGELVDAVACLEEAQQHDLAAEREISRQANKLLELLYRQRHDLEHARDWVANHWMKLNGVSTNNAPFNDLLDRGYPVEIVRDSTGKNLGVRLRRKA